MQTAQRECMRRARESLSLTEAGAEWVREAEAERVREVRQSLTERLSSVSAARMR